MWLVSVSGAYFFGIVLDFGLIGIWIAMMMDECLRALIFIYRWHSGVWRHKILFKSKKNADKISAFFLL